MRAEHGRIICTNGVEFNFCKKDQKTSLIVSCKKILGVFKEEKKGDNCIQW